MKKLFCLISFVVLSASCSSQPSDDSASSAISDTGIAQAGYQLPEKGTPAYEEALEPVRIMKSNKQGPFFPKPEDVADNPAARSSFIFNMHSMKYHFRAPKEDDTYRMLGEYVERQYKDLIESREAFVNANLIELV